jgi:hypothetical protein
VDHVVTDQQVRKLMEENARHGRVGLAALKAGMDRKTARTWLEKGVLPSDTKKERTWRTRPDPIHGDDWITTTEMLEAAPELEAKTIFEFLIEENPDRYEDSQLRTFQRRVHRWRATDGPEKEVHFPQLHRPGEAFQTDFTHAEELGITIGGEEFPHLLCHVMLPYSNWEAATICRSESMAAIRDGVQNAVFRLGRIPTWHQTDNSTAATHHLPSGKRDFNDEVRRDDRASGDEAAHHRCGKERSERGCGVLP